LELSTFVHYQVNTIDHLKNFIHIFIAVLWLLSSTGFSITKHYCGNDYVNMAVNSTPESCCETGGCCHNETEVFQLDEDTLTQPIMLVNQVATFDIMIFENAFFELKKTESEFTAYIDKVFLPPPKLPELLASFQSFLL